MIGYFVIALVFIPVVLLMIAFVLEKPRTWRVPALFVVSLLLQVGVIVAALALFGVLLGLIVPL